MQGLLGRALYSSFSLRVYSMFNDVCGSGPTSVLQPCVQPLQGGSAGLLLPRGPRPALPAQLEGSHILPARE